MASVTRDISVRVRVVGDKEYKQAMKRISGATKEFAGWTDTAMGMLASSLVTKAFAKLLEGFEKSINASIDFESALADVAKVTTMNATELEYFGKQMQQLSTEIPVTAIELLNLAEIAGQLGIADQDIQEFTEVMAALGATTNLSSEEAAESLAKLANIMGTEAADFERLGSTIVELGNNAASTESEIVAMASRIAGVGSMVGLTEADVLALSSALASLGIEADAGGGTISKWLTEMATTVLTAGEGLEQFAKVAGMSAGEFTSAWKSDPAQAFNAWIQGLAGMEEAGQSALLTLGEFGVNEVRMRRVLASLVTGNEQLENSLEMADRAWEENIALTKEAETRYGTSASKIDKFKNTLNNLAVAAGDRLKPVTIQTVEELQALADAATEAIAGFDTLPEMINDIDIAFRTQGRQINILESEAYALVDALEELGTVDPDDSVGMKQYYELLARLKEIAPETTAYVDGTTGAIIGGYDALRQAVAEWESNERLSLEVAKAEEQISALEIAEKQLAATRAQLAAEEGRQEGYIAEAEAAQERLNALWGQAVTKAESTGKWFDPKLLIYFDEDFSEFEELEEYAEKANKAAEDSKKNVDELTRSVAEQEAQIASYSAEIEATMIGIAETSGVAVEGMSDAESAMLGNFQLLGAQANAIYDQFEETRVEAREAIDEIIQGYEKIEKPKKVKIKNLIGGLESQEEYMTNYMELLDQAEKLGVEGDVLAGLADGSTESYAILQAIVKDGGKNLETLQAQQREVNQLKEEFATRLAEVQTDFDTKATEIETAMNEMVDEVNQYPEAYKYAADTIQGIIDGYNSKIAPLTKTKKRVISITAFPQTSGTGGTRSNVGTGSVEKPHAAGLTFVPYDNYPALLHRGEMVLTALEAKAYRAEQYANYGMLAALAKAQGSTSSTANNQRYSSNTDNSTHIGDINISGIVDVRRLTRDIDDLKKRQARGRGAR